MLNLLLSISYTILKSNPLVKVFTTSSFITISTLDTSLVIQFVLKVITLSTTDTILTVGATAFTVIVKAFETTSFFALSTTLTLQ